MTIYSAHDFQIGNLLMNMLPSNNFTIIPYSASVKFELYLVGNNNFVVQTVFDGAPFLLEGCKELMCPIDNWFEYMNKVLYTDPAQIDEQCNMPVQQSDYSANWK